MLAAGLVDGLDLLLCPVAVGAGIRLFPEGGPASELTSASAHAFDDGVVHLVYGRG